MKNSALMLFVNVFSVGGKRQSCIRSGSALTGGPGKTGKWFATSAELEAHLTQRQREPFNVGWEVNPNDPT